MMTRRSRDEAIERRPGPILIFQHGPRRQLVKFGTDGMASYADVPFHGIMSRGLLRELTGAVGPGDWPTCSVLLEAALAGDGRAAAELPVGLLERARACGVLPFAVSAAVAGEFVQHHLPEMIIAMDAPLAPAEVWAVELWNVKEGHTSSVWKVTLHAYGSVDEASFVLNVARDHEACEELLSSAAILQEMGSRVGVAQVLLATRLPGPPEHTRGVAVVAQEWVEDACELGFLIDPVQGRHCLFAIEAFLTTLDEPGRIRAVAGHRLSQEEEDRVFLEILKATLEAATFDPWRETVAFPDFELNEGDWVLAEGRARLVAASAQRQVVGIAEAPEYFRSFLPTRYQIVDPTDQKRLRGLAEQAIQLVPGGLDMAARRFVSV